MVLIGSWLGCWEDCWELLRDQIKFEDFGYWIVDDIIIRIGLSIFEFKINKKIY